ncbi:response regulator [Hyphococcus luteus]|nr:response regulator [Marinicaulis flavus]
MKDQSKDLVADVLIAVDEAPMAAAIAEQLRSRPGVRMISAASDDDLLHRLESERYDALLISEQFHGLIYQGLISLIRSGDLCAPNLPIVLVADLAIDGLEEVAQRYFVKGLKRSDLGAAPQAIEAAINDRPRPLLLLIDDNDQYLSLLAEHLEQSFRVVTTSSPETAGSIFTSEKPDIVVSDYSMPFRDGEGVARELRAINPETPIVILTAHDTPRNHIALTKAGITRFLSKNMPLSTLERELRDLVLEYAIARASKAAANEASATGRLVRAINAARRDLGVGRAAFAAERLKGALVRNAAPPTDDDLTIDDE